MLLRFGKTTTENNNTYESVNLFVELKFMPNDLLKNINLRFFLIVDNHSLRVCVVILVRVICRNKKRCSHNSCISCMFKSVVKDYLLTNFLPF